MTRIGAVLLGFGLLATVMLVVLPELDPLDFAVRQSYQLGHGRAGTAHFPRVAATRTSLMHSAAVETQFVSSAEGYKALCAEVILVKPSILRL